MPLPATTRKDIGHFNIAGLAPKESFEGFSPQLHNCPYTQASAKLPELVTAPLNPYNLLARDNPGEELAPDAAIWQLYVNEASEHDTELLKKKNGNLDVMLLFAALFSAIVTAFLIDSKNLLREDSGDLTVTLLLAIAQSQHRIETSNPQTLPVPQRPNFTVPAYAKWTNGLWFSALSLSLVAALVAMLAKEWLAEFATSRSHSPRTYAHLHQARLQAVRNWRVLYITDLLPSVLHISLLLFSLGLAVYLSVLDFGIAFVQIFIITIALIFYLGTAFLAARYDSCPFATQVSKYLRSFGSRGLKKLHITEEQATYRDLEALLWLTKNARNPIISDCACQALAGLQASVKQPRDKKYQGDNKVNVHQDEMQSKDPHLGDELSTLSHSLVHPSTPAVDCSDLVNRLFDQTCDRLLEANTSRQRDLEACQGMNVARYSNALPALVQCLEALQQCDPAMNGKVKHKRAQNLHSAAQRALMAIDAVWSGGCPQFSPIAYALLATAEIRLTNKLTDIYHPRRQTNPSSGEPNHDNGIIIDVLSKEEAGISLDELQARYSRSLARASILLSLRNDSQIIIDSCSLTHLLDSITTAACCDNLNPSASLSTCLPQSEDKNKLPEFTIPIVGTGTERSLPANDIGDQDSLLPGIMGILSSAEIERVPKVEAAAVKALATLGPVLLRQWLVVMDKGSVRISNKDFLSIMLRTWPKIEEPIHLPNLVNLTLAQLLWVSTVGLSQTGSEYMSDLAEVAIAAFFSRANMESGKPTLRFLGDIHSEPMQQFIQMAALNGSRLPPIARGQCIRLLLVERYNGALLHSRCITPPSLSHILSLLAQTPNYVSEAQTILEELKRLLPYYKNREVSYLIGFMRQKEGFKAIVDVAAIPEYTAMAIEFILCLVDTASHKLDNHPQHQDAYLARDAIEGLLSAMILVIQAEKSKQDGSARLGRLIRGASVIFDRLNVEDLLFIAKHQSLALINAEISTFRTSSPEWEDIIEEWEDLIIQDYAAGEERCLRGLRNLLDSI
ncbi:hypothetical protein RhiJN_26025 [Ceratobasidium sp. AG-Ba]|nr:hypothetical protein RhiJN_26025 [Ceratobasidium sp. AG-Ba]